MADISIEVNEINVVSVENMADISIEVNEINVVSVERSKTEQYYKQHRMY